MEHAKNYEIRCKIIWNIRTKRVAPFPRQCNLRFLSTKVLQGSAWTCVNYGRIFIDYLAANLLQSVVVKAFWKSVKISRSYRQKSGTFFSDTVYIIVVCLRMNKVVYYYYYKKRSQNVFVMSSTNLGRFWYKLVHNVLNKFATIMLQTLFTSSE